MICLAAMCLCVQARSAALTNKDVIDLLKMGMSSDVIVAKIKNSPWNFDTYLTALQVLKTANVPEPVILAMVNAPNGNGSGTATDRPPPKAGVKNLYEVQKIYVDEENRDWTDSASSARKLADRNTIVETYDQADGYSKGTLSTQLSQGTTGASFRLSEIPEWRDPGTMTLAHFVLSASRQYQTTRRRCGRWLTRRLEEIR
jgi:hypothetical protein